MKKKTFKLSDFEAEKISTQTQKIIQGGGDEAIDPPVVSYPIKTNGSGNG